MSDTATGRSDHTRYLGPSARVGLFVSDDLITIGPEATVRQLAIRLAAEGVGVLVVNEGDRILGIVSERDVVFAIAAGRDLDSSTVADLDNPDVVTCTPDTTVNAAVVLMMEHYVRHLVVEDLSGPVGVVSARDLLGAYAA